MKPSEHITLQFSNEMVQLLEALREFMCRFELVFDIDWEMTQAAVQNADHLIAEEGTFIQPMVEDESNDWANRGALLAQYRDLVKCMEKCGIPLERPWHDEA